MASVLVFLALAILVVAASSHAPGAGGCWLHSIHVPSAARIDQLARALAYACPDYLATQPPPEVHLLTDEQLCHAWRDSLQVLQATSSDREMLCAVEERQRYLDEFERRNASGLSAWLGSGPGLSADPLPYLTGTDAVCTPVNWDELIDGQDW